MAIGKPVQDLEISQGFLRAISRYLKLNWNKNLETQLKQWVNFESIRKKYGVKLNWRDENAALAHLYPTDNRDYNCFEVLMMLILVQGGEVTATVVGDLV